MNGSIKVYASGSGSIEMEMDMEDVSFYDRCALVDALCVGLGMGYKERELAFFNLQRRARGGVKDDLP